MSRGGGNRANPAPRCQSWHGRVRGGGGQAGRGGTSPGLPPPPPLWFLASGYTTCSWMGLVEKYRESGGIRVGKKQSRIQPSRAAVPAEEGDLAASGQGHSGSRRTRASLTSRPRLLGAVLRAPCPFSSQLQPFPARIC